MKTSGIAGKLDERNFAAGNPYVNGVFLNAEILG